MTGMLSLMVIAVLVLLSACTVCMGTSAPCPPFPIPYDAR